MIAFLRGVWRRAYMRGFTAGFRDGLSAGLVETVAEHSNVALIPDDVIEAFWELHNYSGFDADEIGSLKSKIAVALYHHIVPEMETRNE